MKKILFVSLIVLLAGLIGTTVAFACTRPYIVLTVNTNSCESIKASASMYAGDKNFREIELYLDGNFKSNAVEYKKNPATWFDSVASPGEHTVVAKAYQRNGFFGTPILVATATETVTVSACPPKKVYVCKYVGTPNVDERLQTGQNPIEVSINSITPPVIVGAFFADAHGRSFVLGFVPMVPEPTAADCPQVYNVCDETVDVSPAPTYTAWSAWTYNAGLDVEERFRDKTTYVLLVDKYNQEHTCFSDETTITEREERQYTPCLGETTGFQFSETVFVRTKLDGTDIFSDVYLNYDALDGSVCGRRAQIRIVPPEVCEVTTDWVAQEPTSRRLPNGDIMISTLFLKFDFTNSETVCRRRVELIREEYEYCSETIDASPPPSYTAWSEWRYNAGLDVEERFRYKTTYVLLMDKYNQQHPSCFSDVITTPEREERSYTKCDLTGDPVRVEGEWSDWVLDMPNLQYTRTRDFVITTYDLKAAQHVCNVEEGTETQTRGFEACEFTFLEYGEWSAWYFDTRTGLMKRDRVIYDIDVLDGESVCDETHESEFDEYDECQSGNISVGEWSDYEGDVIDKKGYREYIDINTGKVCQTEYREKCFSDKHTYFWTDGFCKFRDRTYPDNKDWMVNPPVFMQNAYCGCGYEPRGFWGIVSVPNCDKDGYKYWTELTPYCGFTVCE